MGLQTCKSDVFLLNNLLKLNKYFYITKEIKLTLKKRDKNINQHFVPQFYLRNFTNANGKVHVYDIYRNNFYIVSPAKECYKEYFYDLNLEVFDKFTDNNEHYEELVDDKIRLLNEDVSAVLLDFINTLKLGGSHFKFPVDKRNELYNFILLSIIRTPYYRQRLHYLNVPFCLKTGLSGELGDEKTVDIIHNLLLYGVLSKMYNEDYKLNKLYYQIFEHLIEALFNIKTQLEQAGKLFLLNNSDKKFICSSNPINIAWINNPLAHFKGLITPPKDGKLFDIGEKLEFTTIHFPISSDISILFFNKAVDPNLTAMNQSIGRIRNWNSDIIDNFNLSAFLKAKEKIFSCENNFNDLIKMKETGAYPRMELRFDESKH